jgi:hypothetical protein
MRPLFSFDPPPTFDPDDDPAVAEHDRLAEERRAAQERALEALGFGGPVVVAELHATEEHLEALAVLAPSTRSHRPTHLVIDARVHDEHLDALEEAVGGKWNGQTLESPTGRWLAVVVGVDGETTPRAVVIDWSAP